ncbi:peptidylprolyl isomerase [Amnibacterium flavum]|uniref:peptidylprolyl isomerase n=1 Tax=Amnibacterium flavum TaxID=2173173 RepID=A0A2V1HP91_9MICO|nr:peptidylprolyl isomerase [Amnibacterium flavum]PVZ94345.1 peptidylprolyl isomerase [Amnibacterium flavum]
MASGKRDDRFERETRQRLRDYHAKQTVHVEQARRRRRDNIVAVVAVVVVLALATVAQLLFFSIGPGVPEPTPTPTPSASASPEAGANTGDVPSADIAEGRTWTGSLVLNGVDLGVSLDGATAPQAVSALISLADEGFYDGKTCHRLTNGGFFVLQCGSVNGDGTGDTGFQYGPIENAPADDVYPAGTIAMARQGGNAYSQSTQFFIVYEDTTIPADEAGGYSVVGTVTSGLDQLAAQITDAGVADGSNDGAPAVATTIGSFTLQ